jgi:hypothetical protein
MHQNFIASHRCIAQSKHRLSIIIYSPAMASFASSERLPLGKVSGNKRSAPESDSKPPAQAKGGKNDALSPYQRRIQELDRYCEIHGKTKLYLMDSDEMLWKTGKLRQLGVTNGEESSLKEEEKQAAYNSLTQEQIDKQFQVVLVDKALGKLRDKYLSDCYYGPIAYFINTWEMYAFPAIQTIVTQAMKAITKAKKAMEAAGNADAKGLIIMAFNKAFAAILAIDEAMTDDELNYKTYGDGATISKRVSKLASDLLWFNDAELGLVDPYSRKAILDKLEEIRSTWEFYGGLEFKTPVNGHGLGRAHGSPPPPKRPRRAFVPAKASSPPPPKRPRRAFVPAKASSETAGSENDMLVSFLNALEDKYTLRQKTSLQLSIASEREPEKNALVLVCGTTNVQKLNQLCAYVTGHASTYHYISQRGTSLKGSRIQVELEGATLWLGAKDLSMQAASQGVAHVEDKKVKVVQVFQGLTTSEMSRVIYDSEDASFVRAFWVSPKGERFQISVQAIVSNKCLGNGGDRFPLPRLVNHSPRKTQNHLEAYVPNLRTGFGTSVYLANDYLSGGRTGPEVVFSSKTTEEEIDKIFDHMACIPIANKDGTIPPEEYRCKLNTGDVAAAGLPPPQQLRNCRLSSILFNVS